MTIAPIELPEKLRVAIESEVGPTELPRWTLEALVVEAVREGLISRGYGGEILGLGFHQREEFYARRGIVYTYSEEDLDAEGKDLEQLLAA
ncbi:hypothetical protein BH11ARM2_BH11ARM2_15880 [soil metagenome]